MSSDTPLPASSLRGPGSAAWIPALLLAAAALLGAGCASAKGHPQSPGSVPLEQMGHAGDQDVELWVARLSPEAVLRALGSHADRLARNAAVLEVRISAGASRVPASRDSFRLRLPSGEEVQPLERTWVLALMNLPEHKAGDFWKSWNWPQESAFDIKSPEEAILYIALLTPVFLVDVVRYAVKESQARDESPDVRKRTMLPRVIQPGHSADLLLVFWPRTGSIPGDSRLQLDVRFELKRSAWRRELEIPMN